MCKNTPLHIFYGLLCSLVCFSFVQAEKPKEVRVAVLQLTQQVNLSNQEIGYLTDIVRKIASDQLPKHFLVLTQESIMTLIPPGRELEDCEGTCAVDTGRLLSVKYILSFWF